MATSHPGGLSAWIFLSGVNCGTETHIDDDALTKSVRAAAEHAGVAQVRPVIEVSGKCADCG